MNAKHVFLVEGYGDSSILRLVIDRFNQPEFFFLIHWDRKSERPDFSKYQHVKFIDSISVFWGTDSQVLAEKMLFEAALKEQPSLQWIHLISESDVPMMSPDYFIDFFSKMEHSDIEFDGEPDDYADRVRYYMPIKKLSFKSNIIGLTIHRAVKCANKILRINRLKKVNMPIYKGSNWVSLNRSDLLKVVNFKNIRMFLNSSLADEVYVQTILGSECLSSAYDGQSNDDTRYKTRNSRFIDWNRGNPYQFMDDDYIELQQLKNGKYSFVRKIKSVNLAQRLLE